MRHFWQAENTPLAGPELIHKIEFGATNKITDDILKGTVNTTELTDDLTSQRIFEIFKTDKPELKIKITQKKMMDKYKIWDERTVPSPSGRHLGHYHALFEPFKFKDTADRIKLRKNAT